MSESKEAAVRGLRPEDRAMRWLRRLLRRQRRSPWSIDRLTLVIVQHDHAPAVEVTEIRRLLRETSSRAARARRSQ